MERATLMRGVFRRSWLTVVPEWILAGIVSLSVGLAAYHLGQMGSWEWLVLAGIPQLWAGGRTLQWVGRTRWARSEAREPERQIRMDLTRVRYVGEEVVARVQGRWFVEDYAKFMDFCHHVLHSGNAEQRWPPSGTPSAVARRWLYALMLARVVVEVSDERGWKVAGSVRSVRDVSHRIGEEELRRVMRRSAR